MGDDTELLREIRDLLLVMAEPELAKRDEKRRADLKAIVGKSNARTKAALLLDGSRAQSEIKRETGVDAGELSRFLKALREVSLLADQGNPKLVIRIQPNFFETNK